MSGEEGQGFEGSKWAVEFWDFRWKRIKSGFLKGGRCFFGASFVKEM